MVCILAYGLAMVGIVCWMIPQGPLKHLLHDKAFAYFAQKDRSDWIMLHRAWSLLQADSAGSTAKSACGNNGKVLPLAASVP